MPAQVHGTNIQNIAVKKLEKGPLLPWNFWKVVMICACSYHTKTLHQILPKKDNGTDRQTDRQKRGIQYTHHSMRVEVL